MINEGGGTALVRRYSNETVVAASGWQHILASWDLTSIGSPVFNAYLTDAAVTWQVSPNILVGGTEIDYTDTDFFMGAFGAAADQPVNGCLSEVYINEAEYLDITVESNRRKFISAGGKPVELGSDGSDPTGTAPIIYLPNVYTSFQTNAGSGGNFTVTGALTDCATAPSD